MAATAPSWAGTTERISVSLFDNLSASQSFLSLSADERVVAFASKAPDLVSGDTNGRSDVFVYDRQARTTERVSVATGGAQASGISSHPALSADGRVVAFQSEAYNLVPGDTNNTFDVFVYDRQMGTTERVSVGAGGAQASLLSSAPALSADGRLVAFSSSAPNLVPGDTNGVSDVFVYDRQARTTERVSVGAGGAQANAGSNFPALSADGRVVAFRSDAPDLVSGDTNGASDVFVYDRQARTTERVSVGAGGAQASASSSYLSLSADGRVVAFASSAPDLVSGDTNGASDVFVYDRQARTTERVSVGAGGAQASWGGFHPALSADGRVVAFSSSTPDLVPGDANGVTDVFVYDRQARTTERVSVGAGGAQASGGSFYPALSTDGRVVAFSSSTPNLVQNDANGVTDVFVRDRQARTTERVGAQTFNGDSFYPALSADGRVVAFSSSAPNLVQNDANGVSDVFVRDRQARTTEWVSVSGQASAYPSLSADGRVVAFSSDAVYLVLGDTNGVTDVFVYDRQARTTERVSVGAGGTQASGDSFYPALSADGRVVAFSSDAPDLVLGDTNGTFDVFVRDRQIGTTERVSIATGGAQASAASSSLSLSADGRVVAFSSDAANLVPGDTNGTFDVFVRDRQMGTTERVSVGAGGAQASGDSFYPALSTDGRVVAFSSSAPDLVPGDTNGVTDVFVYDRQARTTERVSVGAGGAQASGDSFYPALSADGRIVAFSSSAPDLVPGDTNGVTGVFVYDRQARTTERVSVGAGGTQASGDSFYPALSANGRVVAFSSDAPDLVQGDTNGVTDVFVHADQVR